MAKNLVLPTSPQIPEGKPENGFPHFGISHAAVIIAFVVTAAVLAGLGLAVSDILLLLGGAGGIGAGVVVSVVVPSRRASNRMARMVRAYLDSATAN
ncbi:MULTISPECIES: hypothetical protein [Streptomyces]|uniref:hypothetical protein n=1 Tax=Streptomyces TaxID=1883 RepID=UPI00364E5C72